MMINDETKRKLKEMKIEEFIDSIELLNSRSEYYDLSFDEKMSIIVDSVYQKKYDAKIKRMQKSAKLRYKADIRDIKYAERGFTSETMSAISGCSYIGEHYNILLHGPCGCGKTFVACAIANDAIQQMHKTLYIRAPELFEKNSELKMMGKTTYSIVKKYASYDLLIIDEWLMYPLNDADQRFISELMEVRYDKTSTIFCSQYKPEDWYAQLGQSTLTEALIDRIFARSINLFLGTKNYRKE